MEMVIFVIGVIILICFLFFWRYTSSSRKGEKGEKLAGWYLEKLSSDYKLFSDLLLPTNYGTTQIDHVILSPFGVFVIEVKNMKGVISGHENSDKWTENIYGHKYEISNAVSQNKAHILALKSVFTGLSKVPFYSIICFCGDVNLNIRVSDPDTEVVYLNQLNKTITERSTIFMSRGEVENYCRVLEAANITDKEIRAQHVTNLRQYIDKKNLEVASGRCPKCGGDLVMRHGKYGSFYGCSNYPYCKFMSKP